MTEPRVTPPLSAEELMSIAFFLDDPCSATTVTVEEGQRLLATIRKREAQLAAQIKVTNELGITVSSLTDERNRYRAMVLDWRKQYEEQLGRADGVAAAEKIAIQERDTATGRIRELEQERDRAKQAATKVFDEIEQIAGKALGYPWFKDDQKNFPGATEANGVCVGEHVAETIVQELANRLRTLQTPGSDGTTTGTCPRLHPVNPLKKEPMTYSLHPVYYCEISPKTPEEVRAAILATAAAKRWPILDSGPTFITLNPVIRNKRTRVQVEIAPAYPVVVGTAGPTRVCVSVSTPGSSMTTSFLQFIVWGITLVG